MWRPYSIYWHKVSIQIPKIKTRGTIRNNQIKAEPNSNAENTESSISMSGIQDSLRNQALLHFPYLQHTYLPFETQANSIVHLQASLEKIVWSWYLQNSGISTAIQAFLSECSPRGFWHCQTVPVLIFSPRSHQPYIFHDYKTSTPWKMLSTPVSCDILAYMQQNYVRFYVLILRKQFHRRLLSSTRNPTLILGLIPFNNLDFYKMEHPTVGTGVGLRICLQDIALLTQYNSGSFSSVVQICLAIIAFSAPA